MESAWNICNSSETVSFYASYDYRDPVAAVAIGILAVIGILGNSLVVYIVMKYRDMQSVTNAYISNLAKADICFFVVCAVPASIQLVNGGVWTFGDFMCRFVVYIQNVSVQATVSTFAAMTVDRCKVIFNPLTSRAHRTKRGVRIVIALIWITSCLMHLPVIMTYGVMVDIITGSPCCTYLDVPAKLVVFVTFEVLVMYAIPLAVIGVCNICIAVRVCNSRLPDTLRRTSGRARSAASTVGAQKTDGGKKQTHLVHCDSVEDSGNQNVQIVVMLLVIIAFFAVCWGPAHAIRLYIVFSDNYNPDVIFRLSSFALCLNYLNSSLNPVLYAYLGKNYRDYAKQIFTCGRTQRSSAMLYGNTHSVVARRLTGAQRNAAVTPAAV